MAGVLVMAEHLQGQIRDITLEAIGAALTVKEQLGGPLLVALVADDPSPYVAQVNLPGVDEIVVVPDGPAHFDASAYEEVACRIAEARQPRVILFGHTANGMAFAPAVAARLGSGFATDVFDIHSADGELVATRGAYGGKANLELGFTGKGVVGLTLRGATFKRPEGQGAAKVTAMSIDLAGLDGLSRHLGYEEVPPADIDIAKADFILSIGRGVKDQESIARFAALAERIGATLGCSRPVVDSGWLPKAHQVGQSGKVAASCKLYVALGISGAVQHLFGMKHIDTIIAVNTDPEAPIFGVATYGACLDLFEFADALERKFN